MIFWDCFTSSDTGKSVAIEGIVKSNDYITILDENLDISAQNLGIGKRWVFQQDNEWPEAYVQVNDHLDSEKEGESTNMAVDEPWFGSYWESQPPIESLNQ